MLKLPSFSFGSSNNHGSSDSDSDDEQQAQQQQQRGRGKDKKVKSGKPSRKSRAAGIFSSFGRSSSSSSAKDRSPSPYAGRKAGKKHSGDGSSGSGLERTRSSSTDRDTNGTATDAELVNNSDGGATSDGGEQLAGSVERLALHSPSVSVTSQRSARSSFFEQSEEYDAAAHELEMHENSRPDSPSGQGDGKGNGDSDDEEESDDPYENDYRDDPEVRANTSANSGTGKRAAEYLDTELPALAGPTDVELEDGPNLVKSPATPFSELNQPSTSSSNAGTPTDPNNLGSPRRKKSAIKPEYPLIAGRPLYERNRCSITLTHGDPDGFIAGTTPANANKKSRRKKTYVVASDLSEESYYAIEWAIGTVLRNGDELLFVTVMETDSKLDPEDAKSGDRATKIRNQQERQTRVLQLSREATALLERTRLHVRVLCQAIHAKNARHMIVDLIDYFQPTLVIIGSRGLSKLKGIILGSVSHYLIQKSSSPVMVTRRRLKPPEKPRRPVSDLQREPRVDSLASAAIDKESSTGIVASPEHSDAEGEKEKIQEAKEAKEDAEPKISGETTDIPMTLVGKEADESASEGKHITVANDGTVAGDEFGTGRRETSVDERILEDAEIADEEEKVARAEAALARSK